MYCRARFGTRYLSRGSGLGNRLFAWARCRVFAKRHGIPVIAPVWFRPGLRLFFRGDAGPKRISEVFYSGLFKRHPNEIPPLRGSMLTWGCREICDDSLEESFLANPNPEFLQQKDTLLVFHGLRGFFRPLVGFSDYLHSELRLITEPRFVEMVDALGELPIVIHVRHAADFPETALVNGRLAAGARTPIAWFVESLQHLRAVAGPDIPATVVSDGPREALAPLLRLPEVRLHRPSSPIADLLIAARAKVLIASGASSFSAWGAWLGQMPAISHPGQPLMETWRYPAEKGQVSVEFDPARPDAQFLEDARRRLASCGR